MSILSLLGKEAFEVNPKNQPIKLIHSYHISGVYPLEISLVSSVIKARRLAESIEKFLEQKQRQKILIDGLRHPDEVTWVKENLQAQVIGVTASPEIRYERTLKRGHVVDSKSREGFTEVDYEDRGIGSKTHENQSDSCVLLADIVIGNNTDDLETCKKRISEGIDLLTPSYINKKEVV